VKRFDFLLFCDEHRIPYYTEGHKHTQVGWAQVPCPFCSGTEGLHLGFNIEGGFFNCWRCGWHPALDVIIELLHVPFKDAQQLLKQYGSNDIVAQTFKGRTSLEAKKGSVKLPTGLMPLSKPHRKYLRERGFDPYELANKWDLMGTGPIGDYKFRIIAPIKLNGRIVSYQGRDTTGKQLLRYKACRKEDELIAHQNIVYGFDHIEGDTGVVVEGITDVWRLGFGSCGTFGIDFTPSQIRLMKTIPRWKVVFDPESQARMRAISLARCLGTLGCDVEKVELEGVGDPAELDQEDADELMKELLSS
jgi:hypothetical protein